MLTQSIANLLVKEMSSVLKLNVNVMNADGYIIASNDSSRLHQFHEASTIVMDTGETIHLTAENIHLYKGVKMGINLPIEFQHEIIGALGITGSPEEIGDRAQLVKIMAELLVKQAYMVTQHERLQHVKDSVVEELLKDDAELWKVRRWMQLLGMPFEIEQSSLFLIEVQEQSTQQNAQTNRLFQLLQVEDYLFSKVDSDQYLLAVPSTAKATLAYLQPQSLTKQLQSYPHIRISSTLPIQDWDSFSIAFQECQHALKLAPPSARFVHFQQYEMEIIVQTAKSPFLDRLLLRFPQQILLEQQLLLTTLFQFNMHIQQTADALFVHRNTIVYRVKRFHEQTGLNPLNIQDAFKIQLLLWAIQNK